MYKYKTIRGLFKDKSRWTKGAYARNNKGEAISSSDKSAEKFCLLGACNKIYGPLGMYNDILSKICAATNGTALSVINLNDTGTHKKILKLVTKLKV